MFSTDVVPSVLNQSDAIASLEKLFEFDIESYLHPTSLVSAQTDPTTSTDTVLNEFNLFSTGSGPTRVSLTEPSFQVHLANITRPREYYFTDPYATY